jgi:hypothetical protein
LLGRRDC